MVGIGSVAGEVALRFGDVRILFRALRRALPVVRVGSRTGLCSSTEANRLHLRAALSVETSSSCCARRASFAAFLADFLASLKALRASL
jgi:hypothetical protein